MIGPLGTRRLQRDRHAFTLVELLVVIVIITILSSTALFTMFGVREEAKEKSTKTIVAQINEIIMGRLEEYRTRPVQVRIPAGTEPLVAAQMRLLAIRQLMRMELPDRKSDVVDVAIPMTVGTLTLTMPPPSLWLAYNRRANAGWTENYQGAECLYMILAATRDGDTTGLDGISENLIGDVDGDNMPEVLDAWGKPIEFLRWAPGFRAFPGVDSQWGNALNDDNNNGIVDDSSEAGWPGTDDIPSPSNLQTGNAVDAPDFFDPLHLDYRWTDDTDPRNDPFVLYPLVFSAGRDGQYDITTNRTGGGFQYIATTNANTALPYPNDPYFIIDDLGDADPNNDLMMGKPIDAQGDGFGHTDNITNHLID